MRTAILALYQTLDVTVTLETTLAFLEKLIPYDSASVMLLDGEGFLVIQATRGYEQWLNNARELKGVAFPVHNASLPIYNIYRNKQSLLIPDVHQEPGWQVDLGAGAVIRNWIGVPLLADGRFIGLLSLDKMEPEIFSEDHIQLAEELADHAALAIQNAQLFQAEQARAKKLIQAQALLFQLEKAGALGRLTTAIAHEINNPIQAIQGCLTLAREEIDGRGDKETVDRYLEIIEVETQRISNIINRMRISHPTAGDQSHQPCDINALLDDVLQKAQNLVDEKHIALQRKWAKQLPLIQADEESLVQAFHNIILNAVEAMNNDDRLSLETILLPALTDDGQPAIQIIIHNTGFPIPEKIKEHLFEPFITTKEQQFGLGLFITHSIIEAHGGGITATSTDGQGTTFTIQLPLTSHPPTLRSPN